MKEMRVLLRGESNGGGFVSGLTCWLACISAPCKECTLSLGAWDVSLCMIAIVIRLVEQAIVIPIVIAIVIPIGGAGDCLN
jgi:hypothetical protein